MLQALKEVPSELCLTHSGLVPAPRSQGEAVEDDSLGCSQLLFCF